MDRTPEFPRKKSRTVKVSFIDEAENKQWHDWSEKDKQASPLLKKSDERKENLNEIKKLGIELDKMIELKQKIIQNSLLGEKNLDVMIGNQIFSQLRIDIKDQGKDVNRTDQVKEWVKQQQAITLKSKLASMSSSKSSIKTTKPPVDLADPKRSSTPTLASIRSKSPAPNVHVLAKSPSKTISRQISNTIKKAREIRKQLTKPSVLN